MPTRYLKIRVLAVALLAALSGACTSRTLGVGTGTPSANSAGAVPAGSTVGLQGSPTPSPGASTQASTAPWITGSSTTGGATVDTGTKTLSATAEGSLTSGVFDYTDPNFQFKTALATSTRPYNLPLPDGRGTDAGAFTDGKLDMAQLGNMGLYHLSADAALAASQTIVDSSGMSHGGTCMNCVLSTGRALFGRPAFSFDGTQSYLKFGGTGQTDPLATGDFTVSFWMYTGNISSNKSTIYGQRDVTTGNYPGEWDITINNPGAGQLRFWMYKDGNTQAEVATNYGTAGTGLADSQWHHIVATRAAVAGKNVMAIYVDGQQAAYSANEDLVNPTNHPVCLGAECAGGGAGNRFKGMIQELGVFNTAWTATNVADVYLRGSPNFRFQIRTCSDPACASASNYVGPNGGTDTYFYPTSNDMGTSLAMMQAGATQGTYAGGRYFQFKVSARPFAYGPTNAQTTAPFGLTNLIFKSQ